MLLLLVLLLIILLKLSDFLPTFHFILKGCSPTLFSRGRTSSQPGHTLSGNHVQAYIFMNALIGGICDNTIVHNVSNLFSTSIIVIVIYIESFYEEICQLLTFKTTKNKPAAQAAGQTLPR